jgi:hypothetical protein
MPDDFARTKCRQPEYLVSRESFISHLLDRGVGVWTVRVRRKHLSSRAVISVDDLAAEGKVLRKRSNGLFGFWTQFASCFRSTIVLSSCLSLPNNIHSQRGRRERARSAITLARSPQTSMRRSWPSGGEMLRACLHMFLLLISSLAFVR